VISTIIEESKENSRNPNITDPEVPSRNFQSSDTNDYNHFHSRAVFVDPNNPQRQGTIIDMQDPDGMREFLPMTDIDGNKIDLNDIFARGRNDEHSEIPNQRVKEQHTEENEQGDTFPQAKQN
jgi:hypothetical protein